jgi:1,4-alpha-glucan branching enzyme
MTPEVAYDYKVGVPENVAYQEALCSDNGIYGGSNMTNPEIKLPIQEPFGEAQQHILISVPPLAGIIFKPVRD